ncbi:conjugal transfer protein TraF [Helicobacter himalayensis]|uniref:conjugal transfer protein TraF n=1 Tax=Helicobacter himalayensis TaxID=1591088 RepID=UPI003D6FEF54
MKTLCKTLLAGFLLGNVALNAQEFNEVGHKSLGMGGTGVAVKNSPYGLFFNPALLAAKPGTKIGYSIGGGLSEKNMYNIINSNLASVQDVQAFNKLLENNNLQVKLSGTLALQLPEFSFGQLAVGFNTSVYGALGLIGYLPTGQSNVDGAGIKFNVSSLVLTEVPVGYAYSFDPGLGKISLGVALKYMNASYAHSSVLLDSKFNEKKLTDLLNDSLKRKGAVSSSNVGIDVGMTYAPVESLTLGLVGKNLNSPSFGFGETKLRIKPQARFGAGFNPSERIVIAADIDLTNNDVITLGGTRLQSQKMGVGIDFDAVLFNARAGLAKDLRQDNGAIISAGIGFGFLDVSLAVSSGKSRLADGGTMPRYVALQVGGGFTF